MSAMKEFIIQLKEAMTPQLVIWIIICCVVYGGLHFAMSKISVFGEGERKFKEAKAKGHKLTGFLDGHTQGLNNQNAIEVPGTKIRYRCYRYRYTHPYTKQMERYYLWQRSNCVGGQIALYYDEDGRVFHSAKDATPLAPLWRIIHNVVPLAVVTLIAMALGWI